MRSKSKNVNGNSIARQDYEEGELDYIGDASIASIMPYVLTDMDFHAHNGDAQAVPHAQHHAASLKEATATTLPGCLAQIAKYAKAASPAFQMRSRPCCFASRKKYRAST
jgi:hypothetical protein